MPDGNDSFRIHRPDRQQPLGSCSDLADVAICESRLLLPSAPIRRGEQGPVDRVDSQELCPGPDDPRERGTEASLDRRARPSGRKRGD